MESALTIAPPNARASASPRADLPEAVGPAMRTAPRSAMIPTVTSVATLISNPRAPAITDAVLAEARRIARTRHPARTLHDAVAAEFLFDAGPEGAASIERELRSRFWDRPIDILIQPAGPRRKRLFLADMDSTMIGQECIDELADFAGLKAHVAAITERAMGAEIGSEPALRERVALLKDMPISVVEEVLAKRITPTPGGR